MSEARDRALAACALLAAVALALGPDVLAGRFWAPADGLYQNLPHRAMLALAAGAGELPFWNAWSFGGMPLFATIQPGALFPGNWTFLVLPTVAAQDAALALAVLGAAASMYLFTRALGQTRAAGVLAGLVFALGGFVTRHVEHVQMVQIAALTPLLLWAIERAAQGARPRYALVATLCVAGMVLAGSPQIAAYGLVLAAAYAIFRALAFDPADRRTFLGAGALAGLFGLGLSAAQLLPTLDFLGGTQRADFGPYAFTHRSLTPQGLPGLFAPYIYGVRGPTGPFATPFWAVDDWEGFTDGYAGVAALLLALVALGRWRAERQVRFWAGVAVVGLVLALGRYTPAAELVARLPVFHAMRYAHRHLFEVTLAIAVLAGFGLSWLQAQAAQAQAAEATRRRALAVAAGLGVGAGATLLAAVAIAGSGYAARLQPHMPPGYDMAAALSPTAPAFWTPFMLALLTAGMAWALLRTGRPAWAAGIVALLALDLLAFGRLQGWAHRLPDRPAQALVMALPDRAAGREATLPAHRYPDCRGCDVLAHLQRLRYPGVSAFEGLATANGYDAFIPSRYGRLLGMDGVGRLGELDEACFGPGHHLLDMVGLRTLRLEPDVADQPAWRARLASGRWRRLPDADGLVVLANPRAMPLGWRVRRADTLAPAEVDARLAGRVPFDPAAQALLDAPDALAGAFAPGAVATAWASPGRLTFTTNGPGAGLVVVSEGYDPGWTAQLVASEEGARALPVLRADGVLMAVPVPPGKCHVVLTYRPRRWGAGLAASGLAGVGLVGWLWAWRRRGRAAPRG